MALPIAMPEEVLENVIPYLTMEGLALSMCGPKPCCTPVLRTGEHVHTWCQTCAHLPWHRAATHEASEACQDCVALRTITQLSQRWNLFCWERLPVALLMQDRDRDRG